MPTMHGNYTAEEKRATRRSEAAERAEARAKRGHVGQLNRLDAMFGNGLGAKKERARLAKAVSAETDAILAKDTTSPQKARRGKMKRQPREQKR